MTEVLLAKLIPPRTGKEIIDRPRLLNSLIGYEERKLTLLTAPAGYGKTVLMLQLSNQAKRALVWYQLDSYDNDPAVFLQYLIAGIRHQIPSFGIQAQQLIEEGGFENRLRLVVTAIVNGLSQQANLPLLLVFDDYQVISEPLLQRFMQDFLEHLPANVHVMIASRALPSLNISRLKTQDEVLNIGIEELRFTDDETMAFLTKKTLQPSSQTQQFLKQKINGWPAALKLAADAVTNTGLPSQISSGTAEIYKYLANEVLEQQPEEIRVFLLSTAILETITPEMCNLLLERSDSGEVLDYLDRQQLFLIPLAGLEKAYRYHQLFRDFLIERLGVRRIQFLRKAGAIALQKENLDQAIEYYILAGIDQELLPLLEKASKEALRHGRWQTVERWLGMLSEDQISADQWLSFFMAEIKIYQAKLDEAEVWVHKSLTGFTARQNLIGVAECQFQQAKILNGYGRHQDSLNILEKAYPVLQKSEPSLRFDLPLEMSLALSRNGRFQEAEEISTQSLKVAEEQNDFRIISLLLEGLGHTYYWRGEHSKALQCYQKGIRVSPDRTLPSYTIQDFVASIYQEWGELDAAYEYAHRNVTVKENLGMIAALPSAYYQLGGIYVDLGELKKAEECYRKGINLAENGGERHILSLNKAYLARCLSHQGRLAEALAIAEQVLTEAETQSEVFLAACRVICAPTFLQNGAIPKARTMLLEALPPLEKWNFAIPLSYGYATLAVLHFKTGNLREAHELSRKLLDLAARKNFVRMFLAITEYQIIIRFGIENDIEVSFLQRILVRLGKRALSLLNSLAGHPDPAVRRRVIAPLNDIGIEKTISILKTLGADTDSAVRQLAGEALQRFDPVTSELQIRTISNTLAINTLGPLQISILGAENTSINWRTSKTRDLLAFLVHHAGPVSKEEILEELWPDHNLEKAQGLFHTCLYYLRQILDKVGCPDLIIYQNKQYELTTKLFTSDRSEFQELIAAGFNDETPLEKAPDFLERAVTLYRGEYLQELDYIWLLPNREYLKNLYCEARLRLARYYLNKNDHNRAIGHLELLAAMDPLSEEIHRLLMTAYGKLGDRLAVIRQYQKLKSSLLEDLGLEPAPEITKLYYEMCGSDISARKRLKKA
ncbi:MAG TPA: BTAD domain-containing putative transcriptional regulator [Bacillota bacterium]|nr:BTAD domain-containing putative transcriptional regulator [Bacillota bacterium]